MTNCKNIISFRMALCLLLVFSMILFSSCQTKKTVTIRTAEGIIALSDLLDKNMDDIVEGLLRFGIQDIEEDPLTLNNDTQKYVYFTYPFKEMTVSVILMFYREPKETEFLLAHYSQTIEFQKWPDQNELASLQEVVDHAFEEWGPDVNGKRTFTIPDDHVRAIVDIDITWKMPSITGAMRYIGLGVSYFPNEMNKRIYSFSIIDESETLAPKMFNRKK